MYKKLLLGLAAGVFIFTVTGCATKRVQSPESPETLMKIADATKTGGTYQNYQAAERLYRKVHELEPGEVEPLLKLADMQRKQNKLTDATTSYNQVLVLDKNNQEARRNLAGIYLARDQAMKSLEMYDALLATNKNDYRALNGMGVLLDRMNEHQAAQICYGKALALNPEDSALLNNYGISFALMGNYEEADKYLQKANEESPSSRTQANLSLINKLRDAEKNPDPEHKKILEDAKNTLRKTFLPPMSLTDGLRHGALMTAQKWCGV